MAMRLGQYLPCRSLANHRPSGTSNATHNLVNAEVVEMLRLGVSV